MDNNKQILNTKLQLLGEYFYSRSAFIKETNKFSTPQLQKIDNEKLSELRKIISN